MRESVKKFAVQMENVLKKYDDERGETGWIEESIQFLINRANEELKEMQIAFEDCDPIKLNREAIDTANFCMMIVDNLQRQFPGLKIKQIKENKTWQNNKKR